MAWTDLATIKTPERVARLPKDDRGYPIFYAVSVDAEGKPNFRVIDPQKWELGIRDRLCGVCGQRLGKRLAFVGGPKSIKSRYFTDLPMHESCAEYAVQVCPFIVLPKFKYASEHKAAVAINPVVDDNRPQQFGIGITTKMKLVSLQGQIVIRAGAFARVQYWKEGQPVSP